MKSIVHEDITAKQSKKKRLTICGNEALSQSSGTLDEFLHGLYIGRGRAFLTLLNVEAHALAFPKGLEARALNCTKMDKNIAAFIFLDEAEPFFLIEPFNRSFCQSLHLPSLCDFTSSRVYTSTE